MARPRVGVSSCLIGQNVRYDGGHKRADFVADALGGIADLVPVCPEVEAGFGVPRPPVQLVNSPRGVRMVEVDSRIDHTAAMTQFARRRVRELETLGLSGYVLKKNSPSCGPDGVLVDGDPQGRGLFAAELRDRLPLLPVVDEGDLDTREARAHFVQRVFAHRRLADFFTSGWKLGGLVEFHASEKLVLMAHEPTGYVDLGRLVAASKRMKRNELSERYQTRFMEALARPATPGRNRNVLQHIAGYFKKLPESDEIRSRIEGAAPLAQMREFLRRQADARGIDYLRRQRYLEKDPSDFIA